MEYSTSSMSTGQQEQTRISPVSNTQSPTTPFTGAEGGSHNRTYTSYPTPYHSPHEFSASQGPHSGNSPQSYPQPYPPDTHGPSLTLNQLLQQGSSPSGYQMRPQTQIPFRSYEQHFPYGYKPSAPTGISDRPQNTPYMYMNAPVHRYQDPYSRTAYPGYPPGSTYPYYQGSQQLRQQTPNEYSATNTPGLSKLPAPATSGSSHMDRPPSRNMAVHGQHPSMSPSSQISSPINTSGGSGNPASANWSTQSRPFGSPQQLTNGQSPFHQSSQQQPRPHSASRDIQPTKAHGESSEAPNGNQTDGSSECMTVQADDDASSRPQSRMSDTGRPSTANSSGCAAKEQNEEQSLSNVSDPLPGTPSDCHKIGSVAVTESPSPHSGTPNFSTASSPSSLNSTSRVSAQSFPTFPQQPTFGVQRLPGQVSPSPRPLGMSSQCSPVPRQVYPSYMQGQPPQGPNFNMGGRASAYYPTGTHPLRPMVAMHSLNAATGGPRACQPGHFNPQLGPGGSGIMPPPAAPPPTSSQIASVTSGSSSQSGFASGGYSAVATNGTSYTGSVASISASADQQQQQGSANSMGPQQLGTGRPSPLYVGPADRVVGYPPSPQPVGVSSSGAIGPVPHSQSQITSGPYPHQPLPVSYHAQTPYQSSQIPYHSHTYPSGMGPNGPVPPLQHSVAGTNVGAPPPYSSGPLAASQSVREHFHAQYTQDRGAPSYGIGNASGISPDGSMHTGAVRMSAGGMKMMPGGLLSKGPKIEPGVRVLTPANATGMNNAPTPSQPGAGSLSGSTEDSLHLQHSAQQPQPTGLMQHPHQPSMQAYSGGYWSEGPVPNQFNHSVLSSHGPPPFSPFQSQAPYRPPMPSQQHMHNVSSSAVGPSPGVPMYGGNTVHQGTAHMHSAPHISSQSSTGFQKLLEMGSEPERRPWLEHYVRFMEEIGKPLVGLPQVVKQPLDLYRFYLAVRERGGVLEVIKARRWKEISQCVNINASASAAYTLRKNYCKFLLDYECRFDQGGTDPRPLLQLIEAMSGKKKKQSSGDNENGSNTSGLQVPAPPSPAGSHSSASSSLLPPGSGSASLSGVPTAGSAASDSQQGPLTQQNRLGEPFPSAGGATVAEGTNGLPSSPSSTPVSSGTSFASGTNISSPQRPSSAAAIVNGYPNTPHSSSDATTRGNSNWPWPSEADSITSGAQQHPGMSINGFPHSPSLGRGSTPQSLPATFDTAASSQCAVASSAVSKCIPSHPGPPGLSLGPSHQLSTSGTAPESVSPVTSSTAGILTASANLPSAFPRSNEPTVHHHSGPYPSGLPCPSGTQPHPVLSQHPPSPGHPAMQHCTVTGSSQSPMHPRMSMPMGIRSSPFVNAVTPHPSSSGDPVAILRMHQFRSSVPSQHPYPPGFMPSYPGGPPTVPAHLIHHHGQRPGYVATILKRVEHYSFPPGTVEATQVEASRRKRYRAKDIGHITSHKLLMALRSGLTAEVSWALNCLNILLRDEMVPDLIVPATWSTLTTNLVELWRHSLGELFDHDLFVTSLELPTDLGSAYRCFATTKRHWFSMDHIDKYDCDTGLEDVNEQASGAHSNRLIDPSATSNGLAIIERDIIALATSYNVPVSTIRTRLRHLLRKCTDSSSISVPLRTRNGLLFRAEQLASISASMNPNVSNTDQTNLPSSRTRKRGKQPTLGVNSTSTSLNATILSSNTTSSLSSTLSSTISKPDAMTSWTAARVTLAANSLKTPEAYANLRELALFALDELVQQETHSSISYGWPDASTKPSYDKLQPTVPSRHQESNKSPREPYTNYFHQLLNHGGGDTTCHIMPPFGAFPFSSHHWRAESIEPDANLSRPTTRSTVYSPTPPPVVVKEKCATGEDLVSGHDEGIDMTEDDDSQPCSKRIRHSSTSSLACPVLSPQPIEDIAEDSHSKELRSSTTPASVIENDSPTCEPLLSQEESEFSQLIMDSSGRCPLRAREELVHHGLTCLWPDKSDVDSNEARAVRCLCVSTVLRNLSFLTHAEYYLSSHKGLLTLIGRVILLGHHHVGPNDTWHSVDVASKSLEASQCAWRTPVWLEDMRENALVLLVNLAGHLDLIRFEESIVRPILEGIMHWIVCPTAVSADPFPGHRTLSPRRLALEAVNRLCVHESNVDLLLSTPGSKETELTKLFDRLANWLALPEDQVTRELALSTLHYLTGGGMSFSSSTDSIPSKSSIGDLTLPNNYIGTTMLALAKPCPIAGLLAFIEAAEATTRRVIDQFGVQALQERPELMGTSLEMVRRAGALLDRLATDPTGRSRFTPNLELRLLDLVTSRVLDATVAHLLCGALHRLSPKRQAEEKVLSPLVPPSPSLEVITQLLKNNSSETKTNPEQHTNNDTQGCDVKSEGKLHDNPVSLSCLNANGPRTPNADPTASSVLETSKNEDTVLVDSNTTINTNNQQTISDELGNDAPNQVHCLKTSEVRKEAIENAQSKMPLSCVSVPTEDSCTVP